MDSVVLVAMILCWAGAVLAWRLEREALTLALVLVAAVLTAWATT